LTPDIAYIALYDRVDTKLFSAQNKGWPAKQKLQTISQLTKTKHATSKSKTTVGLTSNDINDYVNCSRKISSWMVQIQGKY
jgi:hypothetical protein